MGRPHLATFRSLLRLCRHFDREPTWQLGLVGRPPRQYDWYQHQVVRTRFQVSPFAEEMVWEASGFSTQFAMPSNSGAVARACSAAVPWPFDKPGASPWDTENQKQKKKETAACAVLALGVARAGLRDCGSCGNTGSGNPRPGPGEDRAAHYWLSPTAPPPAQAFMATFLDAVLVSSDEDVATTVAPGAICPTCLDPIVPAALRRRRAVPWPRCGHLYHFACVARMRARLEQPACAQCREPWPPAHDAALSRACHRAAVNPFQDSEAEPTDPAWTQPPWKPGANTPLRGLGGMRPAVLSAQPGPSRSMLCSKPSGSHPFTVLLAPESSRQRSCLLPRRRTPSPALGCPPPRGCRRVLDCPCSGNMPAAIRGVGARIQP
eukprot:s3234_g2.t1